MLLSEMVRKIRYEKTIYNESTNISRNSPTDWVTVRTVNFTLPAPCCIIIQFSGSLAGSASPYTVGGNARVVIDGIPIVATGEIYRTDSASPSVTRTIYVVLGAGDHTVEFQLSCFRIDSSSNAVLLYNGRFIKQICFSDMTNLLKDSGYVNVASEQTATVINENIMIPARKTCAGTVKQTQLHIYVYAEAENLRLSRMKNPGEANDSCINWRLKINDSYVSWSDRRNDFGSDTTNQSYAEGAYGYYTALVDAGQTINVKVEAVNNSGGARNVRAVIVVFACPWIIPSTVFEYEPLSLSFPQGSTLYLVLEPLSSDPTKTVRLGYVRAWDLGYNYYSTASGTGVLSWNYTFESVNVENAVLLVGGSGGCISIIAVDVRA
ncbi:MAG: hypothetical protein QXN34_06840 [Archaeoglobaceae archaeon]